MAPQDLEAFWNATRDELGRTPLNSSLEHDPDLSGREFETFRVTLDSYQGFRLRGWYSVPKDPASGGTLPRRVGRAGLRRRQANPNSPGAIRFCGAHPVSPGSGRKPQRVGVGA